MMVFKHAKVTITNGKGMFGSDNKGVRVTRVLKVMNYAGDERGE